MYILTLFLCVAFLYSSLPYNLVEMWLQIGWKFTIALATAFHPKVTWYSAAIAVEQFLQ